MGEPRGGAVAVSARNGTVLSGSGREETEMEGFNERKYPKHKKGDSAECLWCGEWVTDGSEESGYTGEGPDWMIEGDFGCIDSPLNCEEGTGGHQTREDVARELWDLNERREREHRYTVKEIRDGTGFAPDARFVQV